MFGISCLEFFAQNSQHIMKITVIQTLQVKVIFTVKKQLTQLQRKPRKKSEASMGFEPMTSVIQV